MNNIDELLKKEPFDVDGFLLLAKSAELLECKEEKELIVLAQQHDNVAANRLKAANARFVYVIADQYSIKYPIGRLTQAGMLGLENAIVEYNAASDEKFMRFAVHVIRESIENYIRENRKKGELGIMRRSSIVPQIHEYLRADSFDIDDFIEKSVCADRLITDNEEKLIEYIQTLVFNRRLAMCHLTKEESYEDLITSSREHGMEIDRLRWIHTLNVLSIAREFENKGVSMQELLIAGMQGIRNAAFVYNFAPGVNFIDFATPIIRKHIELRIETGELPHPLPYNEYVERNEDICEAYSKHCSTNRNLETFLRVNSKKNRENMFANAKIGRLRKEVITTADKVEWKMVDNAAHLPDDYDQSDKLISSRQYSVQDTLYCGECKDFVKPNGGEWCICTVPDGKRIPISTLTDRESLSNAMEALMEILKNLMETKWLYYRDWRIKKGI